MKPADILRRIAPVGTMGAHERVCAALLDECERALAALVDAVGSAPSITVDEADRMARAALAKLRGEQ